MKFWRDIEMLSHESVVNSFSLDCPEAFRWELSARRRELLAYAFAVDADNSNILNGLREQFGRLNVFLDQIMEQVPNQPSISPEIADDFSIITDALAYVAECFSRQLGDAVKSLQNRIQVAIIAMSLMMDNFRKDIAKAALINILQEFEWSRVTGSTVLQATGLDSVVGVDKTLDGLIFDVIGGFINKHMIDWNQKLDFYINLCEVEKYRSVGMNCFQSWLAGLRREAELSKEFLLDLFINLPRFYKFDRKDTIECFNSLFVNYRELILESPDLFQAVIDFLNRLPCELDVVGPIISDMASRFKLITRQSNKMSEICCANLLKFVCLFHGLNLISVSKLSDALLDNMDLNKFPKLYYDFCKVACFQLKCYSFKSDDFRIMFQKFTSGSREALFLAFILSNFKTDLEKDWDNLLPFIETDCEERRDLLEVTLDSIAAHEKYDQPCLFELLLTQYYPLEVEKFKQSLPSTVLPKLILVLIKSGSLLIPDFLQLFGPSSLMNTIGFDSLTAARLCALYKGLCQHPIWSQSKLATILVPQSAPEFWLRCLLDVQDYNQLEAFSLLANAPCPTRLSALKCKELRLEFISNYF